MQVLKADISLPEALNGFLCAKSVVAVGFSERDSKMKNIIVTLNMVNNSSSEEKTFNGNVCSPAETYFSDDNLPRQKIPKRLKINNSLIYFGMKSNHSGRLRRSFDDQSVGFEKYMHVSWP